MIRTLLLIAAVSFVLTIGFFAGAVAVSGGPFFIDDNWRFHHSDVSDDDDIAHMPPAAARIAADD